MSRNVTSADVPFLLAITVKAIQATRRDIVLGIGNIDVLGDRIDGDTIGDDNILLGSVGDEVVAHDLAGTGVDNGIFELIAHGHITPLGTHHIQGVTVKPHVASGAVDAVNKLLFTHVIGIYLAGTCVVITS